MVLVAREEYINMGRLHGLDPVVKPAAELAEHRILLVVREQQIQAVVAEAAQDMKKRAAQAAQA